jgi:hypothetical protein
MTERKKYDFERLDKYCKENNVTLLEDYRGLSLTKFSLIKCKCIYENCDNEFEKKFENLTKTGAYCKECIKTVSTQRMKETFLKKYGSENILQMDFIKDNTNINKFTFQKLQDYCKENNIEILEDYTNFHITKKSIFMAKCQTENCNEKVKKIFREIEKLGVYCKNCTNKNKKDKTIITCLQKYGFDNSTKSKIVQEKYKETCLKKYGVEHCFQSEKVKDKIKETMIKRYGVENPIQNAEIFEKGSKNSFKIKTYLLPSGNEVNYQGYENYALDELIGLQIDENDIINKRIDVPEIWFYYNDKKSRHYVDIYIKSQNKCIEVKSEWYFNKDKNKIFEKQKAGKELGYNYEIWVYDKKGNKTCYE